MTKIKSLLKRIHEDDSGAMSVEKILILGLIALPILIGLLYFRHKIAEYFNTQKSDLDTEQQKKDF
jgi:Flp pilus assembly pilin Flp